MRRRTQKALRLSAEHAAAAIGMLIADGKIAARDVASALKRREKTIRELRARLVALGHDLEGRVFKDGPFPMLASAGRELARKAPRQARRRISKAQRAARQAQGRYLGALRGLSKDARRKIKSIRMKSGVTAAIAAAKKMAK